MDSRASVYSEIEQVDILVSESTHPDRPEIRAKSSIGLVSFVSEKSTALDNEDHASFKHADAQPWIKAWNCILCGLADGWPLVREAFQEQLAKVFSQSSLFRQTVQQPAFMDQIIEAINDRESALDKMRMITGTLSLANLVIDTEDGTTEELLNTSSWGRERVNFIVQAVMEGWIKSQDSDLKSRACIVLVKSFAKTQLIQSLGALTTSKIAQSQVEGFTAFCEMLLRQLSGDHNTCNKSTSQDPSTPIANDWALALWLCNQLWIPAVFTSSELIHESIANSEIANTFVKRAPVFMDCIGYILRIQRVDNTFTLHRLIIACASFTNSNDLWNKFDRSISKKTIVKSQENLVTIYQTTPWSIANTPATVTATSPLSNTDNRNLIMIPGSFSSNVIQIIEREIRPCFSHVKAQKLVDRAQTTIANYQEKIKQLDAPKVDDVQERSTEIKVIGNRDLVRQQQQDRHVSSQRIAIAPVTDTPNDEEEVWSAMDDETTPPNSHLTGQPQSWDKTFLGSIPVIEWCAQQPIQDPSRIHEVFMLLVGPILAMTDSLQFRHRIRGLNLLTDFLIQYHDYSGSSTKSNLRKEVDSRIWIKIFEKTGLDQVLERSLKPLLSPLQTALTQVPALGSDGDNTSLENNNDELEAISAAFRAYLSLILVNTEKGEKPTSASEHSRPITAYGGNEGANTTPLTVENLFMHAVLGSFKRANPSKEYRTLILEWAKILVSPVISSDFLHEHTQRRQLSLSVVPKTDITDATKERNFQGVYGMGSLTIKYLPTLILYICEILDFPFPSSPPSERLKSLDLAWRASSALCAIMEVSRPRIPRYRGKILASISSCWANSRIFPLETKAPSKLSELQLRLDQSLIKGMQLCIEICKLKIAEDANNGLEIDLKILQGLDPSVFNPLFAVE